MEKKYLDYQKACRDRLAVLERRFNTVGFVKLIHLAVLIAALWTSYRRGFPVPMLAGSAALLLAGIGLWAYHIRLGDGIRHEKALLAVLERCLRRLDGGWAAFEDDGREFISYQHPYTFDLDIFGPKSIYQLLNVTKTYHGRHRFAADLSEAAYTPAEIAERQQAVAELAAMDELSHEFQIRGEGLKGNNNAPSLLESLRTTGRYIHNEWGRLLLLYAPRLFGPAILLMLLFFPPLYLTAGVLLTLQMLVWAALAVKTLRFLSPISKLKYGLGEYAGLYQLLAEQPFRSAKLRHIQEALAGSEHSAAQAFKELDRILQRVELRRNLILYFVCNALFLWDIGCALALDRWCVRYAPCFEDWFQQLGEFESLLSFSVLEQCISHLCYPECLEVEKTLELGEIGHPLIANSKRVYNNFAMQGGITIVSGSNMSGKTTFLRTIGLNLVLARAGAPVCARRMRFSLMQVASSMRISDDLNEGVSTFYAELKKIKAILDQAGRQHNTIFLIDEIFKGTNSADRIAGARQVLERLSGMGVPGFLTTHDLTLCECAAGKAIQNRHFSEQYEKDAISFDYTIRPGVARSTNAEFLMRMIGIIE